MATEFMYSHLHEPSMMGGSHHTSGMNGYSYGQKVPNGRNFAFRKRFERVDWRKVASIDIEHISRTLDFNALQENILNITFCNIEAELDLRMIDPNFIKLFKLAQLSIEYLLHSQEYLTGVISSSEEKFKKSQEEIDDLKKAMEKQKQELTDIKKESHKRKKLLMAQQQLIHAGSGSFNKCPFCPKAFLNSSFLQAHMNRRHNEHTSKAASIAVTEQRARDPEVEELKERLRATESQLQQERLQLQEARSSPRKLQQTEEEQNMYMKEIKEVNKKYQSLQKAFVEVDARSRSKRSNLGDLQDDDEIEREKSLLQQQREELALMKEKLNQKIKQSKVVNGEYIEQQEKTWQKRLQEIKQQHANDIQKLNNALERTSNALSKNKQGGSTRQQQEEVQQLLRASREQEELLRSHEDEVEMMIKQETAAMAGTEVTRLPAAGSSPVKSMMLPSDDDDETTEFGTASQSLTQSLHSTYRSGELTLRTTQFLEELRKNPTLKIMRDELASLLQDHLNKIGIPPETRGLADDILDSKLKLLKQRRQTSIQKYPIFPEFRKQCNAYAEQQAKEKLKLQKRSPPPSAGNSRTTSPARQPPSSLQTTEASFGSSRQTGMMSRPIASSPSRQTPPPRQAPKPQPRTQSPSRNLQSTGGTTKTGSSVDWTSTQWDSEDDYDSEEDDQPVFKAPRRIISAPRNVSPTPKPRTPSTQSTPSGPQPRKIMSTPLHDLEDDDDIWDSDLDMGKPVEKASTMPVRVQPKGQNVSRLSQSIELQLAGRKTEGKPFGGVDTVSGNKPGNKKQADDDSASDWDVSSYEDNEPTRAAPKKAPVPVRISHASDSSNTYGTSMWGASSKAASSVPPTTTGRGSFVSVTDVSSDEDLDLENI